MLKRIVLSALVFICLQSSSVAQPARKGPELQVNQTTFDVQQNPDVAASQSGNFVVVWQGPGYYGGDIFGRVYDSTGSPLTTEFKVNTTAPSYSTGSFREPRVDVNGAGSFVVAWESFTYYPYSKRIVARQFDSTGGPLGGEIPVDDDPLASAATADVGINGDGNFIVVWRSRYGFGFNSDISARRFDSAGSPIGSSFRVNTTLPEMQLTPAVSTNEAGAFVIAWKDYGYLIGNGIRARRFASSGVPLGTDFLVNNSASDGSQRPDVALGPAGDFQIVWDNDYGPSGDGIFLRRYDSSGSPMGAQTRVNLVFDSAVGRPKVDNHPTGQFAVSWDARGEVLGQSFDSTGTRKFPVEFQINSFTPQDQDTSSIAMFPLTGDFVVAWESYAQDGSGDGIIAQIFNNSSPPVAIGGPTLDAMGFVILDGSASFDPEGSPLAYYWDLANMNPAGPSYSFTTAIVGLSTVAPGVYDVAFMVEDAGGAPSDTIRFPLAVPMPGLSRDDILAGLMEIERLIRTPVGLRRSEFSCGVELCPRMETIIQLLLNPPGEAIAEETGEGEPE